jgi:vesicle coat complex subunit
MTKGTDVSQLFSDVINCIHTDSVELKKLVYLYLLNYAHSQPDLTVLAVEALVKVRLHIYLSRIDTLSIVHDRIATILDH